MTAHAIARQLFAPPGALPAHTRHLLAQAAGAHAQLLDSANACREASLDRMRAAIGEYLRGPSPATEKRFVLDDPLLVEALHALAPASPALAAWDAAVAPRCPHAPPEREAAIARGRLGNVVAGVLLRHHRNWCGQIELATDDYGRVHLPFCDWTLVVVDERGGQHDLFAHQALLLELDEHEARWWLADRSRLLVRMPRSTFERMIVDNRAVDDACGVELGGPPWPRFERASRLGKTRIRFEPIGTDGPAPHATATEATVAALLAAIEMDAPHIHHQFCQCIRTIHGFELPCLETGSIASFSVPTSPGVIGFNVQYTRRHQPRLSPWAFMWLGHELGHTLFYLIDHVAYTHGWRFLENPGEATPAIPRYGRSLSVRTLFQVPYVHLFEWWLLILLHQRGYSNLPWQMPNDAQAVGKDLRDEIHEAFELIDRHAQLTQLGEAVVVRLRELVAEAEAVWRRVSVVAPPRRTRKRRA